MHTLTIEQEIDKLVIYQPEKIKEILMTMHDKDPKHTEKNHSLCHHWLSLG